ncbi:hypothetical protein FHL15_010529 [Xylaria flabelliformis]|uniref:Uncharacterized protein n=1 Tax=Xylaria flabelliformis TaxID=2512241 RepID=A0A553HKU3_9PEZI|nr:hypothetical protein FHL15_010529 [Xylaria flabelliformis]
MKCQGKSREKIVGVGSFKFRRTASSGDLGLEAGHILAGKEKEDNDRALQIENATDVGRVSVLQCFSLQLTPRGGSCVLRSIPSGMLQSSSPFSIPIPTIKSLLTARCLNDDPISIPSMSENAPVPNYAYVMIILKQSVSMTWAKRDKMAPTSHLHQAVTRAIRRLGGIAHPN